MPPEDDAGKERTPAKYDGFCAALVAMINAGPKTGLRLRPIKWTNALAKSGIGLRGVYTTGIIRFRTESFNVHCVEGHAFIDYRNSERATWCSALAGVWS